MNKKKILAGILILVSLFFFLRGYKKQTPISQVIPSPAVSQTQNNTNSSPLAITTMRQKSYLGSLLKIEKPLVPGPNYKRYIVSYLSEGLKIYGLLTVPIGDKPNGGWPVILFNHGYIPPGQYNTVESYAGMVDPLASTGFIVFKPDYRGNGNSEGIPTQPYVTPDYVTDSMNAISSIKKYPDANPNNIGIVGHSMGGNITLHELVVLKDIKAAELLAGVVGDETGIYDWWQSRFVNKTIIGNDLDTYYQFQRIVKTNGIPTDNPDFWNTIDPTEFVNDINTPIEIQVVTADRAVPTDFSRSFRDSLQSAGKIVSYHEYDGIDHNFSGELSTVMNRTILFFDKYLK